MYWCDRIWASNQRFLSCSNPRYLHSSFPHTVFSTLQLIDRTDLMTCADASANWCCATNSYSKGLKNSCKLVRFQVNVIRLFTRCSRSNCLAPCNVSISSPATLTNNKSMESETSKSRDEAGTSAGVMPIIETLIARGAYKPEKKMKMQ